MEDVARHVGLSRTTVSFVINGRRDVQISEASRLRIWDAVRELGYRPNAGAQSLALNRSNLVGLVTDITSTPFGGGIIHGAQHAAWKQGKLLLIVNSEGDPAVESSALDMLLERRIEGVIFATQSHREIVVPESAAELPTVLVHCFDAARALPSVLPDEEQGGYSATRRLVDAGHVRIGLINLSADTPAAIGRRLGYERALSEAGIAVDPALVLSGDATADGGYACAAAFLGAPDAPTAFFCANDRTAMGAYDAIKERGLQIPADISVVGYDNQEIIAGYLRPGLTTVALPFDEMGSVAIDMISTLSAGEHAPSRIVPAPLVERGSVASRN